MQLTDFKRVPAEVKQHVASDVFWFRYTHASGTANRKGIEATGKLMAPAVARGCGFVPFTGEYLPGTFIFRLFYLSVSFFPPPGSDHAWYRYIEYGKAPWSPERSQGFIRDMDAEIKRIREMPLNIVLFEHPGRRGEFITRLEENIKFEKERQRVYAGMSAAEQEALARCTPEVYGLGSNLFIQQGNWLFGGAQLFHLEHPVVPAEINLKRYLRTMFTGMELVDETRAWIARVAQREIPVASLDALATWQLMFPELPAYKEGGYTPDGFYFRLLIDPAFRERVVAETLRL